MIRTRRFCEIFYTSQDEGLSQLVEEGPQSQSVEYQNTIHSTVPNRHFLDDFVTVETTVSCMAETRSKREEEHEKRANEKRANEKRADEKRANENFVCCDADFDRDMDPRFDLILGH